MPFGPLVPFEAHNQLDFSPITGAIQQNRQNDLALNKLAIEQGRFGMEQELQPFKIQSIKQELSTGELKNEAALAQRFGGIGQAILAEPDPAKQQSYLDQIKTHPGMRSMLEKSLPPGWDTNPVLVGHFTSQIAHGYEDPDTVAARRAEAYKNLGQGRQANNAAAVASPAGMAAKAIIQDKIERGIQPTPEEIKAAFASEAEPQAPTMPWQRQPVSAPVSAPPSAAPFQRDANSPPGTQGNPAYSPSADAFAQLPPGAWYTTPSVPTPQRKPGAGLPGTSVEYPQATSPQPAPGAPAPLQGPAGSAPLAPGTMLPPGATAGGLQPRVGAPDAAMLPLSAEAQRAYNAMRSPFIDRATQQANKERLEADPTFEARKAQAVASGKDAAQLGLRRGEGVAALSFADKIVQNARAWEAYAPKALNGATGPYNSSATVQHLTGFGTGSGGYALWSSLNHDVNALTALYGNIPSPGANKAATDQANATFNSAIGEWREARDPATMFAIMERMRDLIKVKAGLPLDYAPPITPLDDRNIKMLERYREKGRGGEPIKGEDTLLFHPSNEHYTGPPKKGTPAASAARSEARQLPNNAPQPQRAPDGNFYIPDPSRPGKYLRVDQ